MNSLARTDSEMFYKQQTLNKSKSLAENVNKISCHLYCGFKNTSSSKPFAKFLDQKLSESKLQKLDIAYSRFGVKQYVSDLVALDAALIAEKLIDSSVIMICGSLSMQKDVLSVLATICSEKTPHPLSFYQSRNQILMDCY
ncbi:MAG: hypothetical protein EOP55_07225 [Sphingobacteriales bacterium]|nr:MAG: hypothetical protein EOP55_07225 [Sphingobacteriales bacterium]